MALHTHLVTLEEAEILLPPDLRAALYETEHEAWNACRDWPQRYPEFALGDSCFAHVMNEAVTTFARRRLVDFVASKQVDLDDEPGFLLVKIARQPGVAPEKSLGLKFNKVDGELRPPRNRSFQNASIFQQGFLWSLFEPAPAIAPSAKVAMTMATVGWCPDPDVTREPAFVIACNMGKSLMWSIPLLPPPATGSLPMPVAEPPQGGPSVRSASDGDNKERKAE